MLLRFKIVVVVWFCVCFMLIIFSCNKVAEKKLEVEGYNVAVESIALDFLVNQLFGKNGLFENSGVDLNLDTLNNPSLKQLISFNMVYYADNVTCRLTSPGFLWEDGFAKTYHSITDYDYNLLEKDYQNKLSQKNLVSKINIGYQVEELRWNEFLDKKIDGTFLNVRQKLAFEDSYLVEINCIIRDQVDSSEIHTFYFFIKDQHVYSWDYKEEIYFEELDFCSSKL
ncbi:hypothetical protein C8N25_1542 [Algoriphagus antarcticus]|uniref:Lipoprotein n=2 Tax=Algoriphagus antarcticus TaxID=238540 RepID=A0A3E0D2T4_9BACT|nr:hypothetical protein C8N25_1542 [Algoriphagus antarcticus]